MNPAKLVFLINDTYDAIERSKIGPIYLKNEDGSLLKTAEGCPWCNMAAMQVFQSVLSAQIIKGGIYES